MELLPEEYTRFYIVQALFKLMGQYQYEKISVTDVVNKAGVGRATFYRYFKRKEDVIIYYFEHGKKAFNSERHYYPRCKEDYVKTAENVFKFFKDNLEQFKLIRKARLEYLYLDYLNKNFAESFQNDGREGDDYLPCLYAGMLFNVSIRWLDRDCKEKEEELAKTVVNAVYFN